MATNRRRIFKLGVVDLGVERAALPGGVEVELAVIRHPGASAIVALDGERRVTMLTQYRHAVGGYVREIPAGCRREGETPLECAQRELREEAGLRATRWDRLGSIVTIPSFCDERIDLFLARGLSTCDRLLDFDEVIRADQRAFEQVFELIECGKIIDAKTIAALHLAREFLEHQNPRPPRA